MIIDSQVNKFADNLSATLLDFEDPDTVASATPTLLVIIDSSARHDDASGEIKMAAAQMYGAFSGAFVNNDYRRQKVLTRRGFEYAKQGSCKLDKRWCQVPGLNNQGWEAFYRTLGKDDVVLAYAYAVSWLGYIQAHSDDWAVVVELSRAKALLQLVAEHDEAYDNAGALLYLGAIATTLPPALGGQPEVGRQYFDRALALTEGKSLLIKVEYARRYARTLFNKELHHQLLTDVLDADPRVPGLTLMNAWAQQQARLLLDSESDYFD